MAATRRSRRPPQPLPPPLTGRILQPQHTRQTQDRALRSPILVLSPQLSQALLSRQHLACQFHSPRISSRQLLLPTHRVRIREDFAAALSESGDLLHTTFCQRNRCRHKASPRISSRQWMIPGRRAGAEAARNRARHPLPSSPTTTIFGGR